MRLDRLAAPLCAAVIGFCPFASFDAHATAPPPGLPFTTIAKAKKPLSKAAAFAQSIDTRSDKEAADDFLAAYKAGRYTAGGGAGRTEYGYVNENLMAGKPELKAAQRERLAAEAPPAEKEAVAEKPAPLFQKPAEKPAPPPAAPAPKAAKPDNSEREAAAKARAEAAAKTKAEKEAANAKAAAEREAAAKAKDAAAAKEKAAKAEAAAKAKAEKEAAAKAKGEAAAKEKAAKAEAAAKAKAEKEAANAKAAAEREAADAKAKAESAAAAAQKDAQAAATKLTDDAQEEFRSIVTKAALGIQGAERERDAAADAVAQLEAKGVKGAELNDAKKAAQAAEASLAAASEDGLKQLSAAEKIVADADAAAKKLLAGV